MLTRLRGFTTGWYAAQWKQTFEGRRRPFLNLLVLHTAIMTTALFLFLA